MRTKTENPTCPNCGYANQATDLTCSLCGQLLRKSAEKPDPVKPISPPEASPEPPPPLGLDLSPEAYRTPKILGLPEPWFLLTTGLVLSLIFTLNPILGFMGWFLCALPHEMGHCLVAWLLGCPGFPAISLRGHAVAMHDPQSIIVASAVMLLLACIAWSFRQRRKLIITLVITLALYPLIAFTNLKEVLHLAAGHLGELAFGVVCLWRALSGGFSPSRVERALFAMLGWHMIGVNFFFNLGLIFSAGAREKYRGNGSFGIKNDFLRIAEDHLSIPVQGVAVAMLLVTVIAFFLSLYIWRVKPD